MKTIQEKIKIMQAFADGKRIEFQSKGNTRWSEVISPEWDWQCYDYRVKCDVPRTWEEFCEQNKEIEIEYYITSGDYIYSVKRAQGPYSRVQGGIIDRNAVDDAALLKTKEDAEGLLAQIKLKRLRDAWWGDWRPDLTSVHYHYYICKHIDKWEVANAFHYKHFLVFETREMAEDFLACFKGLIKKAEMWL